jgi:hypothetical protein
LGAFLGRHTAAQKPGFPLQVLGSAHALPVGFPLQSLARAPAAAHGLFAADKQNFYREVKKVK